jgi:hypothetical protein
LTRSGISHDPGAETRLIVAPGSTGAKFEDVGDLGIDIQVTPDTVLDAKAASNEDDLVRLPEKK